MPICGSAPLKCVQARLRDANADLAYDMACLWVHFRADFSAVLSPQEFAQAEMSFQRGAFDREFTEKTKTQDPKLTAQDFRFVLVMQGQAVGSQTPNALKAAETVAEQQAEDANLKLFTTKLAREVGVWQEYQSTVRNFQARQNTTMRENLRKQKESLELAVKDHMDSWYPVKTTLDDVYISPLVQSTCNSWAEKAEVHLDNIYKVYIIDFSKLGTAFTKVLVKCIRLFADAAAANAEKTVGVILGPNTAHWGEAHSEDAVRKAQDEVDEQLRMDHFHLDVRRGSVVFTDASLLKSRTRSGLHDLWMAFSDKAEGGKPACHFHKSLLWQRRRVTNVTARSTADYVVPCSVLAPSPENLSRAQRCKQHTSGQAFFDELTQKLWEGMAVADKAVLYIDVLAYDGSCALAAIQRSLQSTVLPKAPQRHSQYLTFPIMLLSVAV